MGMTMTQKILAAHAGLPSVSAGQLIEAEFILLPYFLYSCKHRKYLKGCKGALYQPACDQQIHPEAGGKRWLQTFFQKFPRRCSDR